MSLIALLNALFLFSSLISGSKYVWLNITGEPVDLNLLNDLPFSCEVCYITLHDQNINRPWCYPLNYQEEAALVLIL